MVCIECKNIMSNRGGNFYDCFNCGLSCKKHTGGQITWYDPDGKPFYPNNHLSKDEIKKIEDDIYKIRKK